MLFTGLGSVRIEKNCVLGLECTCLRPQSVHSRPRAQFFSIRTSQPVNNIYVFLAHLSHFLQMLFLRSLRVSSLKLVLGWVTTFKQKPLYRSYYFLYFKQIFFKPIPFIFSSAKTQEKCASSKCYTLLHKCFPPARSARHLSDIGDSPRRASTKTPPSTLRASDPRSYEESKAVGKEVQKKC